VHAKYAAPIHRSVIVVHENGGAFKVNGVAPAGEPADTTSVV